MEKEDKDLLDSRSRPSTIARSGRQGTKIWSVETQLKGRYTSPYAKRDCHNAVPF